MHEAEHVLISLEQRHAEGILSGAKHVELRRRAMRIKPGTTVWIYVKVPVGMVVGFARVSSSHTLAPSTLWKRFSGVSGLTREEFFDYFEGTTKGFALGLTNPQRLCGKVSLAELREAAIGFHPPQFFTRLASNGSLLGAIQRRAQPNGLRRSPP